MEYVSVKVTGASVWVNPCPCLFHLLESCIPGLEATSHHPQITAPPLLSSHSLLLICFYRLPLIRTLPSSWAHLTSRSLTESHCKPSFLPKAM